MLCRTQGLTQRSQLEGSRLPAALGLPPLPTQAALELPQGPPAVSGSPPGGSAPGCRGPTQSTCVLRRLSFPNVPVASLGIVLLFSLAPVIAGIYGALTMDRALYTYYLRASQHAKQPDFSLCRSGGAHGASQRPADRNPGTKAWGLLTHGPAPALSSGLSCDCLRPGEEEWGQGQGQGQKSSRKPWDHMSHTPCSTQPGDTASPGQISGGG